MNSRSKYLLKNVFSFAIGKMGTKLITFLLVPLYTYALSTQQYGTVDLVSTVCTVLMPILTLNIGEAVMRFCMDDNADLNGILHNGLIFLAVATIIGIAVVPICKLFSQTEDYCWLVYLYTISMAYSQFFLCYLRGQEKLTAYSIGNIIHTAIAAGLNILFLVALEWGIRGYLLAYTGSNFVSAIYAAFMSRKTISIKQFSPNWILCRRMLRYSVVLIPNSFMWWIINSSDRIMITIFLGAASNGIYAIAYKVPSMLHSVSEIFNQAWVYSALRESKSNETDRNKYFNNVYRKMVQLLTIMVGTVLLFIKPFLRFYVAHEYYTAWVYTPCLAIGFLFLSLASFFSAYYMVYKNSFGLLISGIIGAGVNVLLNVLLIPSIGAFGAALATCLSYIAVFLFRIFNTRMYKYIDIFRPSYLVNISLLICISMALYIEKESISVAISVILFVVVVFCNRNIFSCMRTMLKKRRSPSQ